MTQTQIPTSSLVSNLAAAGNRAPSADNSQPWHLHRNGSELVLTYDANRVAGHTFPPWAPATLLAMGGVIEHIAQFADAAGFPFQPEPLPEDGDYPNQYARIPLADDDATIPELEKLPLFQRHTNRFAFKKDPVPTEISHSLGSMFEGSADIAVFSEKGQIHDLANLVHSATEVRFQTQEIHEWLGESLRFGNDGVKNADGLDVATFDLPPGGRQFLRLISDWNRMRFLNRFGTYKLLAAIDAAPVRKAPALIGITGAQGHRGALDAGRLLSRVWIQLNSQGIAVHPYFVVSDQIFRLRDGGVPDHLTEQVATIEADARKLLGIEQDRDLYMILRIGYPTRTPPRSRRLPLETIFTDHTRTE